MPLTDPELDLLRELLADDPTDDIFVQVGEELVRRTLWAEAVTVLKGGLAASSDEHGAWAMLARAALEVSDYSLCLEAWENAGEDEQSQSELGRVHILALERSGRIDAARRAVELFEIDHPDLDVVIEAVKERIDAPPPSVSVSAADPFVTVALAERYAALGRPDRAVRVYRRILFHNPGDPSIQARLLQLDGQQPGGDLTEDLSEELEDPNLVPPDLTMPAPAIGSASVEPAPLRGASPRRQSAASVWDSMDEGDDSYPPSPPTPPRAFERIDKPAGLADFLANARAAERGDFDDPDDPTDDVTSPLPGLGAVGLPTPKRKKKRSLLKR